MVQVKYFNINLAYHFEKSLIYVYEWWIDHVASTNSIRFGIKIKHVVIAEKQLIRQFIFADMAQTSTVWSSRQNECYM